MSFEKQLESVLYIIKTSEKKRNLASVVLFALGARLFFDLSYDEIASLKPSSVRISQMRLRGKISSHPSVNEVMQSLCSIIFCGTESRREGLGLTAKQLRRKLNYHFPGVFSQPPDIIAVIFASISFDVGLFLGKTFQTCKSVYSDISVQNFLEISEMVQERVYACDPHFSSISSELVQSLLKHSPVKLYDTPSKGKGLCLSAKSRTKFHKGTALAVYTGEIFVDEKSFTCGSHMAWWNCSDKEYDKHILVNGEIGTCSASMCNHSCLGYNCWLDNMLIDGKFPIIILRVGKMLKMAVGRKTELTVNNGYPLVKSEGLKESSKKKLLKCLCQPDCPNYFLKVDVLREGVDFKCAKKDGEKVVVLADKYYKK